MASSADIAQQLASYDANRVNSTDALNQALSQYGVPEIRTNVSGLRSTVANTTSALNNVDPSVTGRTSGSLVTEAQRQRLVNMERSPIAQQLTSQSGALTDQEKTLQDALSQATQTADNRVKDWESGRATLQNEYDTTYKREQDAAAAEAARAAAAEQRRQFDESQATTRGAARYGDSGGSGSGGGNSQPTYQQRGGGAFNFQGANGQSISARLYAQLTGTNFNTLLKQMAAKGDSGAADVLKHGASSKAYKALTWD